MSDNQPLLLITFKIKQSLTNNVWEKQNIHSRNTPYRSARMDYNLYYRYPVHPRIPIVDEPQ